MKKAIGDEATIRWYGPLLPVVGDLLRTTTGRMYLVREVRGRALHCVVVPANTNAPFGVRSMRWLKRKPAALKRGRRPPGSQP